MWFVVRVRENKVAAVWLLTGHDFINLYVITVYMQDELLFRLYMNEFCISDAS